MSTNDVIVGQLDRNVFRFPIQFEMFGIKQYISDAVFDTGCAHSLVSIANMNTGQHTIEELCEMQYYNIYALVGTGLGVESQGVDIRELSKAIRLLNEVKKALQSKAFTEEQNREVIDNYITPEYKKLILESKNTRYECRAKEYTIDGVNVGDIDIRVSFTLGNVTLIGMHIIKQLYTKIFNKDNEVYLLSTLNNEDAETKLNETFKEISECIDSLSEQELNEYTEEIDFQALEANYINTLVQKEKDSQ